LFLIVITIMDGQERLNKPLWFLGIDIIPFAWVVMHGAALGVYVPRPKQAAGVHCGVYWYVFKE
jgi:hypothetical protein